MLLIKGDDGTADAVYSLSDLTPGQFTLYLI